MAEEQVEPSKQELKNWRDDPITKYVLEMVGDMRRDTLESSVFQMEPEMIAVIVRAVGGMDRVSDLIDSLCAEEETEGEKT